MGGLLTYRHRARAWERFAPDAFVGAIGQQIGVSNDDPPVDLGMATIRAAEVSADGREVEITLELPEPRMVSVNRDVLTGLSLRAQRT